MIANHSLVDLHFTRWLGGRFGIINTIYTDESGDIGIYTSFRAYGLEAISP